MSDLQPEELDCGCPNYVSVIICTEAFVPAAHWNNPIRYKDHLIEAAVDELTDEKEWYSLELKVPQPNHKTLNPPHNPETCRLKKDLD